MERSKEIHSRPLAKEWGILRFAEFEVKDLASLD
jgi:hypothetical protein